MKDRPLIGCGTYRKTVDQTPPELVADLMESGVVLAGGGALLQGLAQRLSEEAHMNVYVADEPLSCVVLGCEMVLEQMDVMSQVLAPPHRAVVPS